jgi:hypothetical protein
MKCALSSDTWATLAPLAAQWAAAVTQSVCSTSRELVPLARLRAISRRVARSAVRSLVSTLNNRDARSAGAVPVYFTTRVKMR